MITLRLIIGLISIAILSNCSGMGGKNESLSASKIEAYLEAYEALRTSAPEFLNQANSAKLDNQKHGFSDFEDILKKHGLSYPEFVKLNAKIGAIYSVLNAESFMGKMEKTIVDGNEQFDDAIKQIQEQIDDPDVPEETKTELRKSMEELKAGKNQVNKEYEHNKYWADLVLDKTKTVSNQFISKTDVELVKQYFDKITEAYTGGVIPTEFMLEE